jgi:RNA-directed DNA polymerase
VGLQQGRQVGEQGVSSNYWSSTTNANNSGNAWNVNFNNGNVNNNNKTNSYYVRAVRAGKCSLLSFASVYRFFFDCRRRKRGTINAIKFEIDLLENLFSLALDLQKGSYQPSRSVCFVTTRPKNREIFAADFRDRVVHHLVVDELEKIWEPRFIFDSFSSRSGKGIHMAAKRLQQFMLKATCNRKKTAWFLQLDIRSFFMGIDKDILFNIFEQDSAYASDSEKNTLLYLLHRIIFHDCTKNFYYKGNIAMLDMIPAHKSLFKIPGGQGLPIGNLTSQFFANVYLNKLDQYIKHQLKCRYYLRYVDDFILVSQNREQLADWYHRIETFLTTQLALSLKPGSRIKRVSDGADFLGYIIRPNYMLVRKRVVNNLKSRLAEFRSEMVKKEGIANIEVEKYAMNPEKVYKLQQVLSSYLGHFKHANTWKLVHHIFARHTWLREYFFFIKGRFFYKFKHKGMFRTLRSQVNFFRYRLPFTILFFQVGKYVEIYGKDAQMLSKPFHIKIKQNYRGMDYGAGFPQWRLRNFMEKTLALGKHVAKINQSEIPGVYVRERYVYELYRLAEKEMKIDNPF